MAGGTVTITGGNVIHTFTSSGYLTPIKYVNNSLRFRNSASAYLSKTFNTPTNNKIWTMSLWLKRGLLAASQARCGFYATTGTVDYLEFSNDNIMLTLNNTTGGRLETTAVYRDPAAWYHIVIAMDTTQATAANRWFLYVNGVKVTSFITASYPSQNYNTAINSAVAQYIGAEYALSAGNFFDGYMTEFNFIDGQQLAPTSFGTFNSYGVWQPITYGGSYGTNGFYLPFPNNSTGSTLSASYLVVAGGGGGGTDRAGGGGAGGYRTGTTSLNPTLSYTVTVGAGGASAAGAANPSTGNGNSSVFNAITSTFGGGGSGGDSTLSASGGSGGGASTGGVGNLSGGAGNTPSTSPSQGNNGGTSGAHSGAYCAAGGGGAGAVGGNASGTTAGSGGSGSASSITGSSITYAGGGGGGTYNGTAGGGGSGGGGAGAAGSTAISGTSGTANLGGGGGGGGGAGGAGGLGGSGVVILSYAGTQRYTGGTVTSSGGNTIHTFTSSGVLTSIFNDFSPNGNNWTGNNFNVTTTTASTYDSMTDVPTLTSATAANYATLNPIAPGDYFTSGQTAFALTNGNLSYGSTGRNSFGSMAFSSGKFYWEMVNTSNTTAATALFGVVNAGVARTSVYGCYYNAVNGNKGLGLLNSGASETAYGSSWTDNDVIGVAVNMDAATPTVTFYKNNTSQGAISVSSFVGQAVMVWIQNGGNTNNMSGYVNFGQQPFVYSLPSGYVALNTYNL